MRNAIAEFHDVKSAVTLIAWNEILQPWFFSPRVEISVGQVTPRLLCVYLFNKVGAVLGLIFVADPCSNSPARLRYAATKRSTMSRVSTFGRSSYLS